MGKTKDADTLGVHVSNEIIAEIVARGEALDRKKGRFAAMILEKWFADGCPAVSEADRLMQIAKQSVKKPAKKS